MFFNIRDGKIWNSHIASNLTYIIFTFNFSYVICETYEDYSFNLNNISELINTNIQLI